MLKINNILKEEEAFLFFLSIYMFSLLPYAWWVFPALILLPDISMLGYLISNRVGAATYNVFHHKAVGLILYFTGIYFANPLLQLLGLIIFGHASLDRVFGYGLKFPDHFKHTHLGELR